MISRKIIKLAGPAPRTEHRCIGCASVVNPGFCYTGSIIQGQSFKQQETERTVITQREFGTMETWDRTYPLRITEVGQDRITRSVPFLKRNKGLICADCAGNISTIEVKHRDGTSHREMVVQTDARPGFIGMSITPVHETIPKEEVQADEAATTHHRTVSVAGRPDNQWLNVGRKR